MFLKGSIIAVAGVFLLALASGWFDTGAPSPPRTRVSDSAAEQGKTYSGTSKLCGTVVGRTPDDLQHVQAFCSKGLVEGTVDAASAMDSLLWLSVSRPFADAMRLDRLSAEQIVKTWMGAWRTLSGRKAVSISIRWKDVEIAKGDTGLLGGDTVTIK